MKGKRFLGMPLAVVVVVALIVTTSAGAVFASFFFQRSQPAQITIKGGGLEIFSDEACTIPLDGAAVLDFGEVRSESPSTNPVAFWLKNVGTDALRPVIYTDLNSNLILTDALAGTIGTNPVPLYAEGYSEFVADAGNYGVSLPAVTAAATTTLIDSGIGAGLPTDGYPWKARFDDGTGEIVTVVSKTAAPVTLTLIRGQEGTTAVAHAAGAHLIFGAMSEVGADYLEPGEILPLDLSCEADGDISAYLGDTEPFTVTVEAVSDY